MRQCARLWAVVMCVVLGGAAARGEPVTTMPLQQYGLGALTCTAYSPDGKYILTGGGAGAFLWDVQTGEVVRTFSGHTGYVLSLAFSPDGTKVLTGSSDGTARLWATSGVVGSAAAR